jgi:hypothetical protein
MVFIVLQSLPAHGGIVYSFTEAMPFRCPQNSMMSTISHGGSAPAGDVLLNLTRLWHGSTRGSRILVMRSEGDDTPSVAAEL